MTSLERYVVVTKFENVLNFQEQNDYRPTIAVSTQADSWQYVRERSPISVDRRRHH